MKNLLEKHLVDRRNKVRRERLINKNFTIISANCIGGVIYHNLGLRFDSPTINLWIRPQDFIEFNQNLKFYLTQANLTECNDHSVKYPVGLLGGEIHIYFQHYKSFEEARNKWEARKKRVHFDNIYIIMTDRDGITKDVFENFKKLKCQNKIILTGVNYNYPYTYNIRNCNENGHLGDVFKPNFITGRTKLDDFDYVSFLNKSNVDC